MYFWSPFNYIKDIEFCTDRLHWTGNTYH